jgi:hypothetical protein
MHKMFVAATGLAFVGGAALTAPAMADPYCSPGFYYSHRTGECRPTAYAPPPAGVVGAAGATAGAAVGTAGNIATGAVGTAGNIVNCVLGCR